MEADKDIRFTEKKVDESWKEQAETVKVKAAAASAPSGPSAKASKPVETSKVFLGLVQTLGYQALMHLGEIPDAETGQREVNIEAAKEAIDLLITLRDKTQGNLSDDEKKMLETLLTQLQLKFSQSV